MRVTKIVTQQKKTETIISAEFVFFGPLSGKKNRLRFYRSWFLWLIAHPFSFWKRPFSLQHSISFSIPTQFLVVSQIEDALFLLAIPLAITLKEDVHFDGVVSSELLDKLPQFKKYYHDEASEMRVFTKTGPYHQSKKAGHGQFFSLGVDSFYTLLGNLERKQQLSDPLHFLYVNGFDVPLAKKIFLAEVQSRVQLVAQELKAKPVFISTNLRELTDQIIGWGKYHVSALSAVGLLTTCSKVDISGESFEFPDWGLRFGVDSLFSTSNTTFSLIGHNVSRQAKLKKVVTSKIHSLFLNNVRVCWENVRNKVLDYNCSHCQKCWKTHLGLLALGIDSPPTFKALNLDDLEKISLVNHVYRDWYEIYFGLKKRFGSGDFIVGKVAALLDKPLRD